MPSFNTLTTVFVVLTIVFIATTGYFATVSMGVSTHTSVQTSVETLIQTTTVNAGSSSQQQVTTTVTLQPVTTTVTASAVGGGGGSLAALSIVIAYKSSIGFYLANATGWTLYLFTSDTPNSGKSSCYGQCATFWPPLLASSTSLLLPAGVNASSFSTITRTDNTKQLTYQGWPVYFYAGDKASGQTNGQGKSGTWFVLSLPTLKIPANATAGSATA